MNVNQIKTIFLVLAAIARGTYAGCGLGQECASSGCSCNGALSCDDQIGGSGECRHPLGNYCNPIVSTSQCLTGKFRSIFHMICNS